MAARASPSACAPASTAAMVSYPSGFDYPLVTQAFVAPCPRPSTTLSGVPSMQACFQSGKQRNFLNLPHYAILFVFLHSP